MKFKLTKNSLTLACFSLTHALIDLTSAFIVYNAAIVHGLPGGKAAFLSILYDLLAFALQPLAGFFITNEKKARIAMLTGILLILTGVCLMHFNALIAVTTAGIGNALFHLGTGYQILAKYPKSASPIGFFIGPGALGLSVGIWFGNKGFFPFWQLLMSNAAAFMVLGALPTLCAKPINGPNQNRRPSYPRAVLLLLIAIVIRGFVGRSGFCGLLPNAFVTIGMGAAACFGKMIGGIVADIFGWSRITVIGLTLASMGIVFIPKHIGFAFVAMVLFQMTMPITLVATSLALPRKPAFAFGLTCLALIIGTLLAFYMPSFFAIVPVSLAMIVVCAACIIEALRMLNQPAKK